MSSSPSTIYLVTGANRGIGFGLVGRILASRPDAFVYAGVRDPSRASALDDLLKKYAGRISIVKAVSADEAGNAQLAEVIKVKHGRVDTVIANAAVARIEDTVLNSKASDFQEHFTVNVVGTAILFQALHDLLKASAAPRFIPISTGSASLGSPSIAFPVNVAVYGSSKAALNFITRKIHFENEWLTAFPLAPGVVVTDALEEVLKNDESGLFKRLLEQFPPQTAEDAATLLVDLIDKATRETSGGEFINVDGTKIPW